MNPRDQRFCAWLFLVVAFVCVLPWVAKFPLQTHAAPLALPTRPLVSPTPMPILPPKLLNGAIELHLESAPAGLWTVVQWQDALGSWHDVKGWQGTLDADGNIVWWVDKNDLGKGPFRWAVYESLGGDLGTTSDSFFLPDSMGKWTQIEMSSPIAALSGGADGQHGLAVGMQVRVFTTEGDVLRVRDVPGLDGQIFSALNKDALVSIVDGPETDAAGFTWWQVQTEDGRTGWCVELADGIQTLVP